MCPEPASTRVHLWWPVLWRLSQSRMQSPLTLTGPLLSLNGVLSWRQPEKCRFKGKVNGLGLHHPPLPATTNPPKKARKDFLKGKIGNGLTSPQQRPESLISGQKVFLSASCARSTFLSASCILAI